MPCAPPAVVDLVACSTVDPPTPRHPAPNGPSPVAPSGVTCYHGFRCDPSNGTAAGRMRGLGSLSRTRGCRGVCAGFPACSPPPHPGRRRGRSALSAQRTCWTMQASPSRTPNCMWAAALARGPSPWCVGAVDSVFFGFRPTTPLHTVWRAAHRRRLHAPRWSWMCVHGGGGGRVGLPEGAWDSRRHRSY